MTCPQIWSFYLLKSLRFRCSYEQTQYNPLIKHIYTLCGRKWFHLLFIYLFSMLKVLCRMWGYKNLQLLVIIWRIVKFSVVMADFTWNLKFYGKKTLAVPKFPLFSTENLFAFLILLVFSCCFSLIFFFKGLKLYQTTRKIQSESQNENFAHFDCLTCFPRGRGRMVEDGQRVKIVFNGFSFTTSFFPPFYSTNHP